MRAIFGFRYSHWRPVLTPRKTPRQQRSRETVEAILEAAAQLFQRHGYAATTTNKIAERAGVSIGSLYQYFPNKDAILAALADHHLRDTAEEVIRTLAAARRRAALPGLLAELIRQVAAAHLGRPDLHRLLFDLAPRTPELAARFRRAERRIAQALAAELRHLNAGGPDPELNALLAVQGIAAHIHGVLLDVPGDPGGIEARLAAVAGLWARALGEPLEGAAPRPGRHAE